MNTSRLAKYWMPKRNGAQLAQWIHQRAERVIDVTARGRASRLCGWLARMGFAYDGGAGYPTSRSEWARYINSSRADRLKGYDGFKRRDYARGACGVQIETKWAGGIPRTTATIWRQMANPDGAEVQA